MNRVGPRLAGAALDGTLFVLAELVLLNRAASAGLAAPVAAVLAGGTSLPLLARRRAPLIVLAVTGASLLTLVALDSAPGVVALGPAAALYTVVTGCSRRVSILAVAIGAVGLVGAGAASGGSEGWQLLIPVVLLAVVWLASDNVRVRRGYVAELRARAERAEADRHQELVRAAEQERLRVARELHDVIAHHLSVIAIQAGGLQLRRSADMGASDGDADSAVDAIAHTSRQALADLRQLLGVLRHGATCSPAMLTPQPGLARLDELLSDVRAAGLPVTVRRQGSPAALPDVIDLSAYRLIQEALTNVLKHQGPVATDVVMGYFSDRLTISVYNAAGVAGAAIRDHHVGQGLIGMRERVAMFGGKLSAGPRPECAYEVVAEIPLTGAT